MPSAGGQAAPAVPEGRLPLPGRVRVDLTAGSRQCGLPHDDQEPVTYAAPLPCACQRICPSGPADTGPHLRLRCCPSSHLVAPHAVLKPVASVQAVADAGPHTTRAPASLLGCGGGHKWAAECGVRRVATKGPQGVLA